LQISFRVSGGGAFTTLNQRLELTSSPYSIRAQVAGVADTVGSGTVVKSLNGLHDDVILSAGANVTLTPSGNTITLSATGGGGVWSVSGNNAYYTAGNVGIGTASPVHRLSISGGPSWTANGWTGSLALDNGAAFGWSGNTAGQRFGFGHTDGGFFMFRTGSDPGTTGSGVTYDFNINDSGRASIPGGLNLQGEWDGAQGGLTLSAQEPTIRLTGGLQTLGNSWLMQVSSDGPGNLEFFNKEYFPPINTPFGLVMALSPLGTVGIGNSNPQSMLDIVGQDGLSIRGYQPFLTLWDTAGGGNARAAIQNVNGEIALETYGYLSNTNANGWARLSDSGNWNVATLTIRGGADLAEPFDVSGGQVTKGSVMVIDPENPGRLKVSDQAYDRRVAGVVSGAGGVNPGISLHHEGVLGGSENIALSGRVYVLADAANGEIQAGDLLTTSPTPGHAMRVADTAKAQGAILGKAMTGLKQGRGLVLVLVSLE
jgi:hypothetical protein